MKKLFAALSLLLFLIPCWAQENKKMDKMIQEALKRGAGPNGAFCITNKSNQIISAGEMRDYVVLQGYYAGVAKEKDYSRFGEFISILDQLEFYTEETMTPYAFSVLNGNKSLNFSDLKENCSMVYPVAELRGKGWFSYSGDYKVLHPVFWSGTVKNGLIDGYGVGFTYLDNGWGYFEADFKSGFPTANFVMKTITKELKTGESAYAAARDEDIMRLAPDAMGTIRKAISGYLDTPLP